MSLGSTDCWHARLGRKMGTPRGSLPSQLTTRVGRSPWTAPDAHVRLGLARLGFPKACATRPGGRAAGEGARPTQSPIVKCYDRSRLMKS
jgi:hypothetical protein